MNPARNLLQRRSLPFVLLTSLVSLLVCLVCELMVGTFLSNKKSWNIRKITELSKLAPLNTNSTQMPNASEGNECLELKSRVYNLSRAIFSAAILKNTLVYRAYFQKTTGFYRSFSVEQLYK